MKHNHLIYAISIIGLAALILMLIFTSPTEIGPLGVLLFFTIIYIVSFGLTTFLFHSFEYLAFKKVALRNKDYLYCVVFAFCPIMFLMARSFGAISFETTGLIILFLLLAEFLVYKRI